MPKFATMVTNQLKNTKSTPFTSSSLAKKNLCLIDLTLLREEGTVYGRGVKVDISNFETGMDSDVFIEWIQTVEQILEYKNI